MADIEGSAGGHGAVICNGCSGEVRRRVHFILAAIERNRLVAIVDGAYRAAGRFGPGGDGKGLRSAVCVIAVACFRYNADIVADVIQNRELAAIGCDRRAVDGILAAGDKARQGLVLVVDGDLRRSLRKRKRRCQGREERLPCKHTV